MATVVHGDTVHLVFIVWSLTMKHRRGRLVYGDALGGLEQRPSVGEEGDMALINMRVSMPDRTGMLAAVASAVSESSADIVTIDVIHHEDGLVVDNLCIDIKATTPSALRRQVEQVPGVVVEVVRSVGAPMTPVDALELAASLVDNADHRVEILVAGFPVAIGVEWAMALELNDDDVHLTCSSPRAPGPPLGPLPWMPLEAPRRLAVAPWMPTSWRLKSMVVGGLEIAAAPLSSPNRVVVVARSSGRFRPPELRQLEILAHLAIRDSPASSVAAAPIVVG